MNLIQTTNTMKRIGELQPNVSMCVDGDIYDVLNATPVVTAKYPCIVISQDTHSETETMRRYSFTLFYADRLVDDLEDNRLDVQSTGIDTISNVIRQFCQYTDTDFPTDIRYTPFTQRFASLCAGAYAQFTFETFKDDRCPDGDIEAICA